MGNFHTTAAISTNGEGDLILLDEIAQNAILQSGLSTGIITLFCPGSTGAITTIELEEGLRKDFPKIIEKIVPNSKNFNYHHNSLNHDNNGHSHICSAIIGPSLTVPFKNKRLLLGTWQQICFAELDTRNRNRKLEVMIIAE